MDFKKAISSKQSLLITSIIGVLLLIIFVIAQSQIADFEQEAIQNEIKLKQSTERLLFDLKETLLSGADKETKTSKALGILNNIRANLDREYVYLRIEAQQKVNIIYGRLDEIEEAILEDPNSAVTLVDNLIKDLQDSDDLASFGDSNNSSENNDNSSNQDRDFNPDFSDDTNDNSQNDNDNTTNNTDNTEGETDTTDTGTDDQTNTDDDDQNNQINYKPGVLPKVDRDKSETEEEVIELQVGN